MVRPKQTDWDTCEECTHTINVHSKKGEVGVCRAYLCECEEFVKKNN